MGIMFSRIIARTRSYRYYSDNSKNIFVAVSKLNDYGIKLNNFPNLVVIGSQSSGKSSLLEGITGKRFLPKKQGISTRKPVNITTIRSIDEKIVVGNKIFASEKSAADEILRQNSNK